jgi:hypothetical protein
MAEITSVRTEPTQPVVGQEVTIIATVKGAEMPLVSNAVVSFTAVYPSGRVFRKKVFIPPHGAREAEVSAEFEAREQGAYRIEVQNEGMVFAFIPIGETGKQSVVVNAYPAGESPYGVAEQGGDRQQDYADLMPYAGSHGSGIPYVPQTIEVNYPTRPADGKTDDNQQMATVATSGLVEADGFSWSNPDILTPSAQSDLAPFEYEHQRTSTWDRAEYSAKSPSISGHNLLNKADQQPKINPQNSWRGNNMELGSSTPIYNTTSPDVPVKVPVDDNAIRQISLTVNSEQVNSGPNPAYNLNRTVNL